MSLQLHGGTLEQCPVSTTKKGLCQVRVGVYFADSVPSAGGAFTLQEDILKSLVALCNDSPHTFTIFSPRPERLGAALSGLNVQLATYRRGFVEKVIQRSIRLISPIGEIGITKHSSMLDRAARKMGIEFMWFPDNYCVPVNIPYLCNVWDLQHRLQPWFPEVSMAKLWYRREAYYSRTLQRASVIIAGTQAGKEEIIHFYHVSPKNVRLLPHPTPFFALNAPDSSSKESVLVKYSIPSGFLFYPAQFWPHKNHAGLLMAVRVLREKHGLTMPVVFAGADKVKNQAYIKELVDHLDLNGQVHFLGFVQQGDLVGLYRNAFALTYLTFFGPENLPPLEAFALGCPVIASAVSGAEEQLGEAALLVDPMDHAQIALIIKSLYESPRQRQSLIDHGKARATRWTGRDFVRGVFSILDEFEPIRRSWRMKR